ncbi:MAG TPA: hypothetical protein VMW65_14000, partial [Chloroflexota bacterium]|nr:hypothetical protein [Chloroflexota bacterium]
MKRTFPAPTFLLFVLALALSVPLLLGILAPAFVGVGVAGLLALLATTLADYQAAIRPNDIVVERHHEPRLYLAADNS